MDAKQAGAARPSRLGKGLSGLIGMPAVPVHVHPAEPPTPPESGQSSTAMKGDPAERTTLLSDVISVPLASITPSPFQPRRAFEPTALQQLAASIKQAGVMQPILVRPLPSENQSPRYELVAGERRWRAAGLAGLTAVPALVRTLSDEQAAEWALMENLQREDLNPMDRALALRMLMQRFGLTQEQVSERVGLDRSSVANLVRLCLLEDPIAEMIARGELSAGHGKALLTMPAGEARVRAAQLASRLGWSVRTTELHAQAQAKEASGEPASNGARAADVVGDISPRQAVLRDLERQLGSKLGTKVQVQTDKQGKRGRIVIEFYGLDHFDGLLQKLHL